MSKTTVNAVDTWDLSEFLAMLCQVARDAGADGSAPRTVTDERVPAAPASPVVGEP